KSKQLRRASAPSHGMAFAYFSAPSSTSIHYFGHQDGSKKSQDVRGKHNFTIPSVNVEHHDISDNSNMTTTSSVTSGNLPSLSPCSSASSLSSLSSTVQQPPGKVQFSFLPQPVHQPYPIRSKSISGETPYSSQAYSLPNMVSGASYDRVPWSPAKDFLANLAESTLAKPMPDDEGQQVGEYIIGKVIGRGGFSTVKEAIRMNDYSLEKVAVKIVKNDSESDHNDRIQSLLQREITIWSKLVHPNIVPMLSMIEDDYASYIFSEFCSGGNLLQYIKKHGNGKGLDEDEVRNIFLEVGEAVRYMHNDMRLVHKDIKLDNILLDDNDNTWKLCDFGLTEFQNDANGFGELSSLDDVAGGSLAYCPPEQIRSKVPLKVPSVDIWSLGVVVYAMATGQLPFMDEFEPRLQYKILNGRYDETPLHEAGVSDELRDLLKCMFRTKPTDRLNITQVLEHAWCRR
ncbi:14802_t:CDS:2, partial [Acaulospora morrowiae]